MGGFFMRNIESESGQYLITLPRRGIRVVAPEHTQRVMELARRHKEERTRFTPEEKNELWPETEKARIWIMKNCGTLAKRYPKPQDGEKFMESVDYQRRDELMLKARDLTEEIVSSWQTINPDTPIAVVLFGSVAKGLVKHTQDPDPSNIDLAVIGDISEEERERLMDEIRPHRKNVQEWILQKVPFINSAENNPGNAGVMVQHVDKLRKDRYEPTRNYIASGAIPLYDPAGVWAMLENEALLSASETMNHKKSKCVPKRGVIFSTS